MSENVERILSNYRGENPGVIGNLRRMMNTGALAGTGKFVILPVDQGFEHGPARSFQPNPAGYDPDYHPGLAVEAGCNAYAAPFGFINAVADKYAGRLPLVLKVNNSDSLGGPEQPCSAITSTVEDAMRLGCSAIGFTIYPGSSERNPMYEAIQHMSQEARHAGLATVIWSYPRGGKLSKDGETALDVVAYAAHLACQLGAHIVKVKLPTAHIEQSAAKKSYETIKKDSLPERVSHIVKSCFDGKRIVIFSGGEAKDTESVLNDIRAIQQGGGNGTIMGRNAFQRPRAECLKLLGDAIKILKG